MRNDFSATSPLLGLPVYAALLRWAKGRLARGMFIKDRK
jgi:hypothetical protein